MSKVLFAAIASAVLAFAQETASLEGHITDAGGQPVRKAGITLRAAGPGGPPTGFYTANSGADGLFVLDGIAPGNYLVSVDRAGYRRQSYRANPRETMSTVHLDAGQHVKGIDVTLVRSVTLSGRVLDPAGDPVANVSVRILLRTLDSGTGLTEGHSVNSDEAGEFRFPDVAAGRFYLSAGTGNGAALSVLGMRAASNGGAAETPRAGDTREYYAETFYPAEKDAHTAKAIDVLHDDLRGLDIRLRKTAAFQVKGKVTGALAGRAPEQCRIVLAPVDLPAAMRPTPQGATVWASKDGSFAFPGFHFPPGEYFLMAMSSTGLPKAMAQQRLVVSDRDIEDAVLDVQAPVDLRGSVALEGERQTDFSRFPGSPPPSVTMSIGLSLEHGQSMNYIGSRIKADDGSFTIAEVPPGEYEVRLSGIPGDAWVRSVKLGADESADRRIRVTAASGAMALQITLSRSVGQIEGFMEQDPGKPATGGSVTVFGDRGQMMLLGVPENGRFTVSGLAPGTYRLYAWEDFEVAQRYDPVLLEDFESASVKVTVKEKMTAQVTLRQIRAVETRR